MPIFVPRGDYLVLRYETVGMVGKLAVSERSPEGNRYVVETLGPECKVQPPLKVGDIVIVGGPVEAKEFLLYEIPGGDKRFLTRDCNVIGIRRRGEPE
jgi:hypothetical protein